MVIRRFLKHRRENWTLKYGSNDDVVQMFREQGVRIGKGCSIARDASFGSEPYLISIGDHVRVAMNVTFHTHDGGLWVVRELYPEYDDVDKFSEIVIGNNVHIGWGATILPGVHIGNNVIIGAAAVVTKDVPSNTIVAGVPARVIEDIDEYIKKNKDCFVKTKKMNPIEKKQFLLDGKDSSHIQ